VHGGGGARSPGSYALTIVASGASGGGLKDYGVFHNEPVYTIYVDLAGTGGSTWTLQYALIRDPGSTASAQNVVSPPYVLERHTPQYPEELARRFQGRMIIMQGVIDTEGKVRNLRLIQSPHPQLTQPLQDALTLCTFGPASVVGKAAQVKILLGAVVEPAPGAGAARQ
jgi:hypothetical protein